MSPHNRREAMAFGFDSDADPPVWLPWLQVGALSLLAVLFGMLLIKSRDQNQRLQQLEMRLKGMENSRSLDRTATLELQLRSLAERMRGMEGQRQELESTRRERDEMRTELQQLRSANPVPSAVAAPPSSLPEPPSAGMLTPPRPLMPAQRGMSGVLRPTPAETR